MCGIVGVLRNTDIVHDVLKGLSELEYRGYDSSGIAVVSSGLITCRKSVGKLSVLKEDVKAYPIYGTIGIGHTRWATHGPATVNNAHPHATDRVAIVHNGIIENYVSIKKKIETLGYSFVSETDTESILFLIDYYIGAGKPPLDAVQKTIESLHGAFALSIVFRDYPNLLIGTRKGSPLAYGIDPQGAFLASDALALSVWTDHVTYLEEGDTVMLEKTQTGFSAQVFSAVGLEVTRPLKKINALSQKVEKGEYSSYMLKEIHEQPDRIQDTLQFLLTPPTEPNQIPSDLLSCIRQAQKIKIIACGTSYYAGLIAHYWLEEWAGIEVTVEIASEFRYRHPVLKNLDLAILISQSGETSDTLAALNLLKKNGVRTLSIVNVPESSLMRLADFCLQTWAGPEICVATTKAFTTQLITLLSLAFLRIKEKKNLQFLKEIWLVPSYIQKILEKSADLSHIAHKMQSASSLFYLGRGHNYPVALEGALKMKELSYIHAEAYPSGELKHGPMALMDESVFVVIIAPFDSWFQKTLSNAQEVLARGVQVIFLTDSKGKEAINLQKNLTSIHIFSIETLHSIYNPILFSVVVQILSHEVALLKGCDIDQPRNLAKSVTVE